MSQELKRLPNSQVETILIIPAVKVAQHYEEVYKKLASDVKIPGFRPGKAPRNLIEEMLGGDKIYQEVFDDLLFEAYRELVREHKLEPITYPQFHVEKYEKGSDLKVRVVITVRPKAKVGDYKKIKVAKKTPKVTDEDVKKILDQAFENWKKDHGGSESVSPIATATSLSEAESKAETHKSLTMEEFLKETGVPSQDELLHQIRHELEHQAASKVEMEFENELVEKLEKMTEVELPEALIEQELASMVKNLETQLVPLKIKLDEYLQQKGETLEKLRDKWKPTAEKRVKVEFALSEITAQEQIIITDEEVEKTISSVSDEKIKKELEKPEQKVYIKYSLQREKTLNKLKEIASQE